MSRIILPVWSLNECLDYKTSDFYSGVVGDCRLHESTLFL